jgi:tetratricopeptide (TPR) repeat protein
MLVVVAMRQFVAVAFLAACGPSLTQNAQPKLKAAKPEAIDALRDAARLQRLGPANYERAVERLKDATQLDDSLWEAHYDIGWLELKRHHPAVAAAELERALQILPTHAPTVEALGQAYLEFGRFGDAARIYRGLLDKKPDAPAELRVRLGEALRRAGKLDDAISALQLALRASPRSTGALNELGLVYEARGQHELADLVLHRALDVDEKSKAAAETWNNLGLVALAMRHDQAAFAHFDQASKLDPSLTVARRNKALVYLDCGDYARAADELKALTRVDPSDVDAWVALGVAERGRGSLDAAGRAFEKALEIDPAAPDALFDLAVLSMDFKKDKARAESRLREFLAAAPATHPRRAVAAERLKELAPKGPLTAP